MKRKPMMAGNWKMNLTAAEGAALVQGILENIASMDTSTGDILVAPPFTTLYAVSEKVSGSPILLAGQTMHWEENGAFTGEISPLMLKDAGCTHVILGHSERRQYFCETSETVNKKVHAAFKYGLTPIMCVGESLEERENGKAFEVIGEEIEKGLKGLTSSQVQSMIVAYEPLWAIGTGKTATPGQAEEVHAFIRQRLEDKAGQEGAGSIRILYGGSVKPDNVEGLMKMENIDGGLVGGASLKTDPFSELIKRSF